MDLDSLKVVESESISILYSLLPVLCVLILGILALGDDKGGLLDKYRADITPNVLKLATAVSLTTLIIVPFCSKHLIDHDIKITNEVEFSDTKIYRRC